ncbi:hypothetical protein Lesp02_48090 [Lentzea sp. NBRC 105346]|uniref:contact-dependent growth inhibition system immunity protein n=1 Tax=Lentzea sp. NBRC 105346 TaxID=3032205 RepID=UPI0024A4BEA5|nr:contact-dependent growth inhibition system immunity protein [Lentzea sp. NBRC 105346]GLZ32621.1 hypothetical protein Lesp02_48090 [Lentzea sp. NBRC 105346]
MATDFDRQLTLAQLAGDRWSKPGPESTWVYRELHKLRRRPVRQLCPMDLRELVTHHVALEFTVPLALEEVEEDPLVEAYMYSGDLLASILYVDHSFWEDHACLRDRVSAVLDQLRDRPYLEDGLIAAAESFPG